jgi:translation initiation factor IF-2
MSSMSDSDKKPTLGRRPLGLKTAVEAGEVKQTFSHGRTNKVVVEVKRRKLVQGGQAAAPAAPAPAAPAAPRPAARAPIVPPPPPPVSPAASRETRQELQARLLRQAEEARLAALEAANRREQEERLRAIEEERRRAEENRAAAGEAAAAAAQQAAEAVVAEAAPVVAEPAPAPVAQAPAAAPAPVEAAKPAAAAPAAPVAAAPAAAAPAAPAARPAAPAAAIPAPRRFTPVVAPKRPEPPKKPAHAPRDKNTNDRRQAGKLTVTRALNEDEGARARSLAALKRAREKERRAHFAGQTQQREKQVRDVIVPEAITVQDLANRMAEKAADLIKALFKMGMMVTINQTIDQDTAELLVTEFGHNIQRVNESDVDIDSASDVDAETTLKARPPWLRSWATSTTARPACSTRCAAPTWCAAKRAASRSTSAPIRSRPRVVTTSPSSTRRATKPSPKCACAGRMSPTS